jgi:hypothetical protein
MSLLDQFKTEQWDAVEERIADIPVLRYEVTTPRENVKCLVWEGPDGGYLFHTAASNSFNEQIAADIVANCQLVASDLPGEHIRTIPVTFQPESSFEIVAVAPPAVQLFDHLSDPVKSKMYLVAPAYRSEFHDRMTAKDFRHQMGRKDGWRVHIYRWARTQRTAPAWD